MTISQAIITFLQGFDEKLNGTNTDILDSAIQSFALYKTPRENVKPYITGKKEITGSYDFMCRLPCQTEKDRVRNQEWLSALSDWIERQDLDGHRPLLDGAVCSRISVSVPYYMGEADKGIAVYSMTISIKRTEEH